MQITVNGAPVSLDNDSTLIALFAKLDLGGAKIAVELNRQIVPRSNYASQVLKTGDVVEIVQAIGGG
ncbi:MAG: sulfur carrier protein ThiS [Pseudohongiellaceae bacterium]